MKTCAKCESLKCGGMVNSPFAFCGVDGGVVPHSTVADDRVAFWRIPLDCPRSDTEKASKPIPEKDWEYISYTELMAKRDQTGGEL